MDSYEGLPYDPASLHKYLYAGVDPVDRFDPSGRESLGELIQATAIYVGKVAADARSAFAAGSTAVGLFFNSIGAYAESAARGVIQLFTRINSEEAIEETVENVPVFFNATTRRIDFWVKAKDGISNLLIEAKYSLPRGGEALTRLVGQVTNSIESGKANQVVVWSLRDPTVSQVKNVCNALGGLASQVQFVHGVEGLFQYLTLYYGR